MRSREPPTCCRVEVMNGGLGCDVYGFVSTERDRERPVGEAVLEPRGRHLVEHRDVVALGPALAVEVAAAATRWPSRSTSEAVKAGSVGNAAARSQ